jgi:hypothetical protein
MMQVRTSRRNDNEMEKELRYKSVCGCEKRNVHALVPDRYRARSTDYERLLQTQQLGYHARTKEKPSPKWTVLNQSTSSRRSRVSLPTEGFTFTCPARVQGTIWPLNQVSKLRVDTHGRGNLHLSTAVHVDRELRSDALATRSSERPD